MLEASMASRVIPIAHEGQIFFQWQIKKSISKVEKQKTCQSRFENHPILILRSDSVCSVRSVIGMGLTQFTARDSERSGLLTRLAGIGQPSAFEALLVVRCICNAVSPSWSQAWTSDSP